NVKARSREPYSVVDVTALIEQNNCDRLELEKVKQHYKDLFDSIKILRTHTSEKTSTMLNEIESLKAQLRCKETCFTSDYVKPKVLAPGMYAIDVKPIPHPLKNNRSAHLNYIGHLKESVETVREIVEEAREVKPLDSSLNYACRYTKLSQELLECVIGTCPKSFNERDNKAPSTPVTRKKQVTFSDKLGTSSSNTQKHKVHQRVQLTNIPVLPSTGVNDSTEASGSKPRSNTKKNRILPAKKENKKEVEVRLRTNKSVWTKVNRVDSSISSKRVVINSNSESVNSASNGMCVVNVLNSVNATPTVRIVLHNEKQIWKPKGKLSDNSLNTTKQIWKPKSKLSDNSLSKTQRVWKATGKLFTDIGYQWRPTGKKLTLGKLDCGSQWRPTGKKFALGEMLTKRTRGYMPDGVYRVLHQPTGESLLMRKERKARTLMLMAIPKDHLRRFHGMDDAKEIWAAIKTRYGVPKPLPARISQATAKEAYSSSLFKATTIGYSGLPSLPMTAIKIRSFYKRQADRPRGVASLRFKGRYSRQAGSRLEISYMLFKLKYDELQSEFGDKEAALTAHKLVVKKLETQLRASHKQQSSLTEKLKCGALLGAVSDHSVNDDPIHDHIPIPSIEQGKCLLVMEMFNSVSSDGTQIKSQSSLTEKLNFQANQIFEKDEKLKKYRRIGMKAVKDKDALQKIVDSWFASSKNLWKLIDCGMSSTVKIGLGYGIQSNAEVLGYEEEISRGIFALRETDAGYYDIPLYSRFKQVEYKGVPHPLSGDYTPREQEDIDDSLYEYGKYGPQPQSPSPTVSDASSTVYSTCPSNDSDGELGAVSDHSVNDDPIHDHIPIPSIEQVTIATQKTQPQVPKPKQTVVPSCAQHVKTPRQPIRTPVTPSPIPSNNRQNWNQRMERDLGAGYSFERKPCFVCGSLSHLIKDCDYYEKKMAREAALKSQRVVHADVRQATPAWTNTNRVNKANQFTPRPVQLSNIRPNLSTASKTIKTGKVNVNTGHEYVNSGSVHVNSGTQIKSGSSRFNTGKQNVNSGSVHVNSGTQIKSGSSRFNTGKQNVNSGSVHVNSGTRIKSGSSRFNTGKQNVNSGSVHVNTARVNRPVSNQTSNKTSPKLSQVNLKSLKKCFSKQSSPVNRPFSRNTAHKSNKYAVKGKMGTAVKTSAGCVWRQAIPLSNTNSGPTPDSNVNDHPLKHMEHRGIFDSGCSGHMTGNRAHLEDYQELSKVGSVTFGGSKGSISGKGNSKDFSSQCCQEDLQVSQGQTKLREAWIQEGHH
ncbi:hypothetical protein Tco_0901719, partial [Tanacetum coccineum]